MAQFLVFEFSKLAKVWEEDRKFGRPRVREAALARARNHHTTGLMKIRRVLRQDAKPLTPDLSWSRVSGAGRKRALLRARWHPYLAPMGS